MPEIRTRFAPSPTGALHPGTVRTALFAWLLARHDSGTFVLRIEDTDQKREVAGGTENIKETLRWLGLEWDEGPDAGGPFAPYVQSERLEVYWRYAKELVDKGLAYADPYSIEKLAALREKSKAANKPFLYRDYRPENPPAWNGSQPLRIKLEPKKYAWDDAVMGRIEMGPEMVDDYIIIKADGFPTYNFCHIIDDYEMKITHVLRSQEFIASIPKFLATHEVLGWQPPVNAIAPPVLGATGGTKLSKRLGAKPVLQYRDEGYLPEAMVNYMAALGWNNGTEQEIFTLQELVKEFSLERVQRSGARFDEQRLLWINGQWIRRLSLNELYERCQPFWPAEADTYDETYKKQVLALVQDRLKTLAELPLLSSYFFYEPTPNWAMVEANKQLKKVGHTELMNLIHAVRDNLADSDFSAADLTDRLNTLLLKTGQKPAVLFGIIRLALTWAPFSPGLADTMAVLGKQRTLSRLAATLS